MRIRSWPFGKWGYIKKVWIKDPEFGWIIPPDDFWLRWVDPDVAVMRADEPVEVLSHDTGKMIPVPDGIFWLQV